MEKSIVLTRPVRIRGRLLKKGTKVQVTNNDRANLVRLGWAKDVETEPAPVAEPEKPKRAYKRKDIAAAPEAAVVVPESTEVVAAPVPKSLVDEVARVKDEFRSNWLASETLTRPKASTEE